MHTCTMFCECPTAARVAGGTAAVRAGEPRTRPGAPSSPREAVLRVETEQRGAWKVRDPR
jgi:hypothetical protein